MDLAHAAEKYRDAVVAVADAEQAWRQARDEAERMNIYWIMTKATAERYRALLTGIATGTMYCPRCSQTRDIAAFSGDVDYVCCDRCVKATQTP